MAMEDPGWGGYVPLPDEAPGRRPPTGGEGSGSQPPGDKRPWWRRNIVLATVAAVAVLGVVGGTMGALASGGSKRPGPTPPATTPAGVTTPASPPSTDGGTGNPSPVVISSTPSGPSADPFTAFAAQADAICSQFKPKLMADFGSWNSGSTALLSDSKELINALTQLGSPPSSSSVWQLAMQDWQQAVGFLIDVGDAQDWQINIWAGADQFHDMGIQSCGSYRDIH